MTSTLTALTAGVTSFAATNIDDLVLLTLFFARRVPTRRIVAGQYLGFAGIVVVSLLGAWAAFAIPQPWIKWLGVLPLLLGLKELFLGHRGTTVEARASGYGVASIALLTLSNGADNVGVYVPLFAIRRGDVWLIVATYMALIAVWCAVARWLGSHAAVLGVVDRWGHRITPLVLIGLGIYVLAFH
ncbi:MAG: cadmium resistance transporter [Acidobacteria bacterium]|nr:cadmium resistance transporter [Acidobacteriota bacterium]